MFEIKDGKLYRTIERFDTEYELIDSKMVITTVSKGKNTFEVKPRTMLRFKQNRAKMFPKDSVCSFVRVEDESKVCIRIGKEKYLVPVAVFNDVD